MSAALALLASCQRQDIETGDMSGLMPAGEGLVSASLTASFVQTKVTYSETTSMNLKPSWTEGDIVIGFDQDKRNYSFTVSSVDADGNATLEGSTPLNCTLHLIYLCGADKDDIKSGSLLVDYTGQAGDGTMPAVMVADGEVAFGSGNFHFRNAGAVIGINATKGVPNGSIISKITVYGDNISAATITLSSNKLALTAGGDTNESISTDELSGVTVSDEAGVLSKQVLIAVPAGAKVREVLAEVDNDTFSCGYSYTLATPATLAANQYTYVAGKTFKKGDYIIIAGTKWATQNLSLTQSGKKNFKGTGQVNGDYFQWAASYAGYNISSEADKKPENLIPYTSFQSTACGDGGNSFSLKPGFDIKSNAPYYDGSTYLKSPEKLQPDDDIAHIILGGSWRMPTKKEFEDLYAATFWAWHSTDCGYYVFSPVGTHTGGNYTTSFPGDLSKDDALLFFPAAGYGGSSGLNLVGLGGFYWTSSLNTSKKDCAYTFAFSLDPSTAMFKMNGDSHRYDLGTIRPVCD